MIESNTDVLPGSELLQTERIILSKPNTHSTLFSATVNTSPCSTPKTAGIPFPKENDASADLESIQRIDSKIFIIDEIHERASKSVPIRSPRIEGKDIPVDSRSQIFDSVQSYINSESLDTIAGLNLLQLTTEQSVSPDALVDMEPLETVYRTNLLLSANLHTLGKQSLEYLGETPRVDDQESVKLPLQKRLDALAASLIDTTEKAKELKLIGNEFSKKIKNRVLDLKRLEGKMDTVAVKRKAIKDGISKDTLLLFLQDMDFQLSKRLLDLGMERNCSL
ncbi:hypothetical protein HK096_000962 [Nowakowskiella sp. JEL0078]|nr:hypothetical protein HK096_000962 [Nowakowskiella sp. JEL0078]